MMSRASRRGFSLVELLVAMTLGLLLTSGMISVFAGNRASSELNAAIANMQENARFALDAIAADARSAGFQGCIGVQSGATRIVAKNAPTASYIATATSGSVIGSDDDWKPDPPPTFVEGNHSAVPGTHAVSLQFGESDEYLLRSEMTNAGGPTPNAVIKLARPMTGASAGDFAIIANCDQADLFAISELKKGGENLLHKVSHNDSGSLGTAYGNARTIGQTSVMLFRSNVYYVGDTDRDSVDGNDIFALYRQSLPFGDLDNNPPVELVSGVENMRIAFGVRESGGNLRYRTPDDTQLKTDMVESIKIGILMTSRESITSMDDERTYILAGQAVPAASDDDSTVGDTHAVDRRHRLAFNTTVKIRNRRFHQ